MKRSASDSVTRRRRKRFADLWVRVDEAVADHIHDVVDVADDRRHERVDLGAALTLGRTGAGPDQDLRVSEDLLERRHALRVAGVEVAEAPLEGVGIGLEPCCERRQELVEARTHVGDAEDGVERELVDAQREAHRVTVEVPLVLELADRAGQHHDRRARRAGERDVVGAEAAPGEVADQRAGGHAEQHRAEHAEHAGEPRLGVVLGELVRVEPRRVALRTGRVRRRDVELAELVAHPDQVLQAGHRWFGAATGPGWAGRHPVTGEARARSR